MFFDDCDLAALVARFRAQGLIATYLGPLRPGKEASIHCCRRPDGGYAVLKHYTRIEHRSFRKDADYGLGTGHTKSRAHRAIRDASDFGLRCKLTHWTANEHRNNQRLRALGLRVPRPIAHLGPALLTEMIGGPDRPARQLREAVLDHARIEAICAELEMAVRIMLGAGLIHGDLSPYNVIIHRGRPWIIDTPQMIEAAVQPGAERLFRRDCRSLFGFLRRQGADIDPDSWADTWWQAWEQGEHP